MSTINDLMLEIKKFIKDDDAEFINEVIGINQLRMYEIYDNISKFHFQISDNNSTYSICTKFQNRYGERLVRFETANEYADRTISIDLHIANIARTNEVSQRVVSVTESVEIKKSKRTKPKAFAIDADALLAMFTATTTQKHAEIKRQWSSQKRKFQI